MPHPVLPILQTREGVFLFQTESNRFLSDYSVNKGKSAWYVHRQLPIIYLPKTESYHPTALSGIPHRSHRHTPDTFRK